VRETAPGLASQIPPGGPRKTRRAPIESAAARVVSVKPRMRSRI
jgi:hypothetical protein